MMQIFSSYIKDVLIIAPAYSKVRYRGSIFRPFVRPSVRSFVRTSNETVFMWLRFRILDTYVAICLCVA